MDSQIEAIMKRREDRGEARGEARGTAAAKRSIAASLKANNVAWELISKTTDLSIEEIEQLPTEAA